jgi:hypothetical protein
MRFPRLSVCLLLALGTPALAQTTLPLQDLTAFRNPPKNWSIVGDVTGTPTGATLQAGKGQGILLNTPSTKRFDARDNLLTNLEHGDIHFELDYLLPKGANSGIYLMGRYEIQLFDSWGVTVPKVTDNGSLYERWDERRPAGQQGYEGLPPRTNASRAPGLWQHLEIDFEAPKFDASGQKTAPAKLVRVVLNGATIHENVLLSGPTRSAAFDDEKPRGPLMIQGDHGAVALRNIRYELFDKKPVALGPVQYDYYAGQYVRVPRMDTLRARPVRSGTTDRLSSTLAPGRNNFLLVFNGTLQAPEADTYRFRVRWTGQGRLEIDGKPVLETGLWVDDTRTVEVPLTAGEHRYTLLQTKETGWGPKLIGLWVSRAGTHEQQLHAPGSIPDLDPVPLIGVQATREPELVRSFVLRDGRKRVRALNVGDPSGVHYTYDLAQAALLHVWKGPFLNATEMWHERGEPQLAEPLGAPLRQSGTCPVAFLPDRNAAFPDSLDPERTLVYRGYTLDAARYPTFRYQYGGGTLTDRLEAYEAGRGLTRRLRLEGAPTQPAYGRLAQGTSVRLVAPGWYLVDGTSYVYLDPKSGAKPFIRPGWAGQELVLEIKPNTDVTYALVW